MIEILLLSVEMAPNRLVVVERIENSVDLVGKTPNSGEMLSEMIPN